MPVATWLFLSFAAGLVSLPVVAVCLEQVSEGLVWIFWFFLSVSDAPWAWKPPAWKVRRYAPGVIGLCVLVLLLLIAVGEALFNNRSFNIEKALESDLYIHIACAFMAGLLVAQYQIKSRERLGDFIQSMKDGGTFPWQTQVAGIVFLAVLALIAMRPAVLDRLALFKAGDVEAHFTEGSSSTIKEAPIVFSDFGHKEILKDWRDFGIKNILTGSAEQGTGERLTVYKDFGADTKRIEMSNKIFGAIINPIFRISLCLEGNNMADVARNNLRLKEFVELYANLIRRSERDPELTLTEQSNEIERLKEVERKSLDELEKSLNEVTPAIGEVPATECAPDQFVIGTLEGVDIASVPEKMIWDPYIIATVADLIAFIDDQSARAEFLNDVSGPLVNPMEPCNGNNNCFGLTPGAINLLYYDVDAKVKSHWTWPLGPQVKYLEKALDGIEKIVSRSGRSKKECLADLKKPRCAIRPYLLRSKFINLSLGLELYYRHALSGEILEKQDLVQWRFWLEDMQRILNVLLGINPVKLSPFVDEYSAAWQEAAAAIQDDDGAGLIADAESGTAIWIVLLAKQTGTPTSDDCIAAESLSTHLLHHQIPSMADRSRGLCPSQLEAYKGLIIEFDNRIRAECPTR